MPRDARIVCANVPYHVTQRGNYRQDIFEEEKLLGHRPSLNIFLSIEMY